MKERLMARFLAIPVEKRGQLMICASILTHLVMLVLYCFQALFRDSLYYLSLAVWYAVLILERMFFLHLSRKPEKEKISLRDRVVHLMFSLLQGLTLSGFAVAIFFLDTEISPKRFLLVLNLLQILLKLLIALLPPAKESPEWLRWNKQVSRFEHGMLYLLVSTQLIYTFAWGQWFVYLVRGVFVMTLVLSVGLMLFSLRAYVRYVREKMARREYRQEETET